MTAVPALVDTAVLAYAVGGDHPMRSPCQRIVRAAGRGELELHASVELVQEFVFHRMRRVGRRDAVAQARDVMDLCVLHDFDIAVLSTALELIAAADGLGGRDAIHAATALRNGLTVVISPDRAFDGIPHLRRFDPTLDPSEIR